MNQKYLNSALYSVKEIIEKYSHEISTPLTPQYAVLATTENYNEYEKIQIELQNSMLDGIKSILSGEVNSPKESHECWLKYHEKNGWKLGDKKSWEEKTNPCMVPFDELPVEHQTKNYIFFSIVKSYRVGDEL